jgi:hypothetical protein
MIHRVGAEALATLEEVGRRASSKESRNVLGEALME